MRKLTFLLLLFLSPFIYGQSILNGDFEDLDDCPPSFDFDLSIQTTSSIWITAEGTPDGWHLSCEAINPESDLNASMPSVGSGEGYGGLFSPYESFGQELDAPLVRDQEYCLELDTRLTLFSPEASENSECFQLCVYGTSTPPPAPQDFDLPSSILELEGMTLLGCSEPVIDSSQWLSNSITFTAVASHSFLFFAMNQIEECFTHTHYYCIDNVDLSPCLVDAVEEAKGQHFIVSPNPVQDELNIAISGVSEVYIYDLNGRVMYRSFVSSNNIQVSMERFPSGIYIVRAISEDGALMRKVVKN